MPTKGSKRSLESRQRMREARLRYYEEHPERRAEHGEYMRRWYAEHPGERVRLAAIQSARTASPETRAKMSAAQRAGYKEHPERGERIGAAHRGRTYPYRTQSAEAVERRRQANILGYAEHPERRDAISKRMTGRPVPPRLRNQLRDLGYRGRRLGYQHSAETKAKMSASAVGRERSAETREKNRQARLQQTMPKHRTRIELALAREFEGLSLKYAMQVPLHGVAIADFVFPDAMLIVEADGDYWHRLPGVPEKDAARDAALTAAGWTVMRFWESEIKRDAAACAARVAAFLAQAGPAPQQSKTP